VPGLRISSAADRSIRPVSEKGPGRVEFDRDVQEQIDHAFRVERILRSLGWAVLVIGMISLAGIALLWLNDDIGATRAVGAAVATLLGTVLAGAGTYGAGTNLGMSASRFALAEQRHEESTGSADAAG
jgi:hypothetical protein